MLIIVENTCQGTQRESCNRLYSIDSDYDECCICVIVNVIVTMWQVQFNGLITIHTIITVNTHGQNRNIIQYIP